MGLRIVRSCLQDGGEEWCCPSCGADFLFEKHLEGCEFVVEEPMPVKKTQASDPYPDKEFKVVNPFKRPADPEGFSKGRDYGDENQFPRQQNGKDHYAAGVGSYVPPEQYVPQPPVDSDYGFPVPPVNDPSLKGIGGAPTRATTLPHAAAERKRFPIASGVMDYFPDAIVAIAEISFAGNEQHNPGQPLHWARDKSGDEADTMQRHFLQRGTRDTDGKRHSAKMAWRALAFLQKEIENER